MKLSNFQLDNLLDKVIDYRGKTPIKTTSGIRLITAKVIKNGRVISEGNQEYINPSDYHEVMKRGEPQQYDIFITTEAPLGQLALWNSDEKIALAQRVILLRPDLSKVDPYYLFYYLQSNKFQSQLYAHATGTTVLGIKNPILKSLVIDCPSLDIQKKIGNAISNYDHLIENNRKRIALLEESARLLYQEWFVKFRFPDCKIGDEGFPEGWNYQPLSQLIEINPKVTFEKDKLYPFVPMQSLSESNMLIDNIEMRKISGGTKFQNFDTLLARITPCLENGKTGFVQFLDSETPVASGSTEYIVMRSKLVNPYWVYCLARDENFREHIIASMRGSDGRQRVNPQSFDNYWVLQPIDDVLNRFEKIVAPMFEQIQILSISIDKLQKARDELLPKLISGQIKV